MLRRLAWLGATLVFALGILVTSLARSSAIEYVFSQSPNPTPVGQAEGADIKYNLAYPGGVLPDSPLWPLKVLRDKAWVFLNFDHLKKADMLIMMADKRLASAQILFKRGKSDLAASVMTKAEKYLEEAQGQERIAHGKGINTNEFLKNIALASLKHKQTLDEILEIAPEDAKPLIVETQNYPKRIFQETKVHLSEEGIEPVQNPL